MLLTLVQEDPEANLESLANKVSPKRAYGKKVPKCTAKSFPRKAADFRDRLEEQGLHDPLAGCGLGPADPCGPGGPSDQALL